MFHDDTGAFSMMRVVTFLVAIAVIVPKVILAVQTKQPVVWGADDIEMLGAVLGAKLVQNTQENPSTTATTSTTITK